MRPTKDQWAMALALVTSKRSTCLRRSVGCVLLNERGHVLSTGYNGVAAGLAHCNEKVQSPEGVVDPTHKGKIPRIYHPLDYHHACPGHDAPSGKNLDGCQAIHAEQNAMLQCRDVYTIHTCYVTASPCMTCTKLLLNTSCKRVVYAEEYPHVDARVLWESSGRVWEYLDVATLGKLEPAEAAS